MNDDPELASILARVVELTHVVAHHQDAAREASVERRHRIEEARARGATLEEIGTAAGISRQAVQQAVTEAWRR